MKTKVFYLLLYVGTLLTACSSSEDGSESRPPFKLESITVGEAANQANFTDVPLDASIELQFSDEVDESTIKANILLTTDGTDVEYTYTLPSPEKISISPSEKLKNFTTYKLVVNPGIKSVSGALLESGQTCTLQTSIDNSDKFERIPLEELLTLVQKQTFDYFWTFGHEHSGMARERSTSGNTVTTGGTGFGIMAMLVAAERGFVSRAEALQRVQRIVTFLDEECESYHGAFSHWINGETGATQPFSQTDNGADLVETSFLFEGLLTARAYFDGADAGETKLREDITRLWEAVEWTWFQKDGEQVLYWHWSPDYGWTQNLPIRGWNECLITYVLAASSPTYPISREVYEQGWAKGGNIQNGNSYYGITLPLGSEKGGPLFFTHYSFLGLNPTGLQDKYCTDYFDEMRNLTLINRAYCVRNPKQYKGYGPDCWGLTASYSVVGYAAHAPNEASDHGVISPTAALSSIVYTPEESMQVMRYLYDRRDKVLGAYGFYDAFSETDNWYPQRYLAIDQGPIAVMIENYRSGLLWKLFMSHPDVQKGLEKKYEKREHHACEIKSSAYCYTHTDSSPKTC